MMAWLRSHRQALASALASFPRSSGVLGALVIGVALSLPSGGYALLESLRGLGARLTLEPQISVFLRAEATRADAEAMGAALKADHRVTKFRFISREDALKDLKSVQGFTELIAALGRNPLPDTFVVTARDGSTAALETLAIEIGKLPSVGHVQADPAWARRLAALAGLARLALWLLGALLGAGLIAVTFNTIRLQVLTRREEIEVSKLIGATDAFVRRPFYYLGLLQGIAGGGVALAILAASLALLNREARTLAELYGSSFRFSFPPLGDAAAIVLFAGLIGWLGAYLSVNHQLRQMDDRQGSE